MNTMTAALTEDVRCTILKKTAFFKFKIKILMKTDTPTCFSKATVKKKVYNIKKAKYYYQFPPVLAKSMMSFVLSSHLASECESLNQ